jgi:antitoxin MazE
MLWVTYVLKGIFQGGVWALPGGGSKVSMIALYERCLYERAMEDIVQKKLSAVGNSLGLIIEKPILELLRIDKDTMLEVSTDGEALIIRPVRESRRDRVRDAAERIADTHAEAFEKLAR